MNRLNRFAFSSLAAAGLWLGLAFTASAQAPQSTINPEQACKDDAFRLCNNDIPELSTIDFDALLAGAQQQRQGLENERLTAARAALPAGVGVAR